MPDVNVNGCRLNFLVEGPQGAPWVTFSNSLATDLHLWDAQAALLTDRFRILRYDTRGHGKSESAPGSYDFAMLESDLIGLWDRLGIERSHLVGLSLGGSTGIGLAIHHPGRIISLAACDCRVTAPAAFRQAWEGRIEIALAQGMAGLVEETMGRWFTAATLAADPPELAKIRAMIRATSVAGFIGCARALQGIDYLGEIHGISCPTLFVVGAADPAASPELAGAMQGRLAGSTLVELPGAAHISNIENAEAFNAAVIGFLDSVVAR